MQLLVGTSGFSYKEWRGEFYEDKLPASQMLASYAARLPTVELNNTFYRMPAPAMLSGWGETVPASFRFAVKAPRRITHVQKLSGASESVQALFRACEKLGDKLGITLFQLPPFLRKDLTLIAELGAALPASARVALEFRHASWFCDETYQALSDAGMALCAAEVDPDDKGGAPFVRTAPFTYARLRRSDYDDAALSAALERIVSLRAEIAYVYFKHERLGPRYALDLMARYRDAGGSV